MSNGPALSLLTAALLAGCHSPQPLGVTVQEDLRAPLPWRELTSSEQATFDLGHAVFNTQWSPANQPAGRRDGLGPLFNSSACDACHNSGRRGRGPRDSGDAPQDLVIQLGRRQADGGVIRGTQAYGYILNTSAQPGTVAEATVTIRYEAVTRTLSDGTQIQLRKPRYDIGNLSGPQLPADTMLMPRMPPSISGTGLLERVPLSELESLRRANGGEGLNDRDIGGTAVNSKWRTAPLWGIQASVMSGQPLRLLHDGRARSIEEAVLWHDGEGRKARQRYEGLSGAERRLLLAWIEGL